MRGALGDRRHVALEVEPVREGDIGVQRVGEGGGGDPVDDLALHGLDLGHQDVGPHLPGLFQPRRRAFPDRIAGVGQHRRRRVDLGHDRRVAVHVLVRLGIEHADRALRRRPFERNRAPERVAPVARRHRLQAEPHARDLARHRALHRHQLRHQRPLGRRARIVGRHPAEGRLDRRQAVRPGREAQRPADIVAVGDRADAGGHRRPAAARRAARIVQRAPRVPGRPVQRIVGEGAEREFRRVGQADRYGARLAQVGHDRRIVRRDHVPEGGDAVGVGLALVIDVDLDRDRDAVERAQRPAGRPVGIGPCRSRPGILAQVDDDGVERGVRGVHPRAVRRDRLGCGNVAVANGGCGRRGGPLPDRAGSIG